MKNALSAGRQRAVVCIGTESAMVREGAPATCPLPPHLPPRALTRLGGTRRHAPSSAMRRPRRLLPLWCSPGRPAARILYIHNLI